MQEIQLPLSLNLRDDCTFESYVAGSNENTIRIIKNLLIDTEDAFVYIWGQKGVGCSHLLQAACHYVTHHHGAAFYTSLSNPFITPSIFKDLERVDLICLDDLETIAGDKAWEVALFHLYNRLKDAKKKLIVASHLPAKGLEVQLPDLKSRLQWGIAYQIWPLNDYELVSALQLRAKQRGMILSQEVCEFIIKRVTRSMSALYDILEQLDKLSLSMKRNLTIPFVKMALKL